MNKWYCMAALVFAATSAQAGNVTWQGEDDWYSASKWIVNGVANQTHPGTAGNTTTIRLGTVKKTSSVGGNNSVFDLGGWGRLLFATGGGTPVVWDLYWDEVLINDTFVLEADYIQMRNKSTLPEPTLIDVNSGTIIVHNTNGFRAPSPFSDNWFSLNGPPSSTTLIQMNNSDANKSLTKKVEQGFFRLDGAQVFGTGPTHAVNGKWFEIAIDGSTQTLTISGPTNPILIDIDPAAPTRPISAYAVGIHQVYAYVPDTVYDSGHIQEWARAGRIGSSRFPGGTTVKYWDWENPTGVNDDNDPWSPGYDPSRNWHESFWTSVDEYLDFLDESGIKPMFGVNSLSGYKYNREQDSIDRAVRMVDHVGAAGYAGAVWYIGNEEIKLYSGGIPTAAGVFQRHADAMKVADPNILIFWNDNSANGTRMEEFLSNDGGSADGLESHGKYPFGTGGSGVPVTVAEWRDEVPIVDTSKGFRAYRHMADTLRDLAYKLGRGSLLIANNEWGFNKDMTQDFNRYELGVLAGEIMMEHIIGDFFSSAYWDLRISGSRHALADRDNNYRLNPMHFAFDMLADVQGGDYLQTIRTPIKSVHGFAANNNGITYVYLLNKTTSAHDVEIAIADSDYTSYFARRMQDGDGGWGEVVNASVTALGNVYSATLPPTTFTEFAFFNPDVQPEVIFMDSVGAAGNQRLYVTPTSTIQLQPAWQGDNVQWRLTAIPWEADLYYIDNLGRDPVGRLRAENDNITVSIVDSSNTDDWVRWRVTESPIAGEYFFDNIGAEKAGTEGRLHVLTGGTINLAPQWGGEFSRWTITPAPLSNLILTSMCSSDPAVERRWRVRNSASIPIATTWELYGQGVSGSHFAPVGDSFFITPTVGGSNTLKLFWTDNNGDQQSTVKASSGAICP